MILAGLRRSFIFLFSLLLLLGAASADNGSGRGSNPQISIGPGWIEVDAVSVDAHELFTRIGDATGLKILVDDTVNRRITVHMRKSDPSDLIKEIASAYGLSCSQVDGVLMISEGIPRGPSSYLLSDIDFIRTQYVIASNAKSLLPVFLQDHVKVNPEQNAVVLSAPSDVLKKFREDIKQFDIPAAQIMVEVLMVELTDISSWEWNLGIDWKGKDLALRFFPDVGELTFKGIAELTPEFYSQIKALLSTGKARIKANPMIATISGQRSSIFIGKQKYLSTPVSIQRGEMRGEMNYIDAGIRLDMTPWTGGDEIIVELNAEVSTMSAVDPITRLPEKSTRTASTLVRVKSGQTIVMGGLEQEERRATRNRLPVIGSIPFLGDILGSVKTTTTKTKLVLFITPKVLSQTGHLPPDEEKEIRERFLR